MIRRHTALVFLGCALCFSLPLQAQRTAVYTELQANFKKGLEFFDLEIYPLAQEEFRKVLHKPLPANEADFRTIYRKAELYYARSALRQEQPEGPRLMLDFVRRHEPDPAAAEALHELASYHFNKRDYNQAIEYYTMMDTRGLSSEARDEVIFNHAYALYSLKRYDQARSKFAGVKQSSSSYYHQAHYYSGMCSFLTNDYREAIKAWKVAEGASTYRQHIPYYIVQVYAAQEDYDQLIAYALPVIEQGRARNLNEIHQLLGQAYFEKGDYVKALPHLKHHEQQTRMMRVEDFYQLGFTQYRMGQYKDAIESFRQLDKEDSPMGQSAMYYLADCYVKADDLPSARNAFLIVSRSSHDAGIQEDALFQFAKLSAQLRFERDAINALTRFQPTSRYYADAQAILAETLKSSRDYSGTIRIIEGMTDPTPGIRAAYQKVAYQQALIDYSNRNTAAALVHLEKSMRYAIDPRIAALATFWRGEIHFDHSDFAGSKSELLKFMTLASGLRDLPPESSSASANYTLGYAYLKTDDFPNALKHFDAAISEITRLGGAHQVLTAQVLPDAYLRSGDCNFNRNRYDLALASYDRAIATGAPGHEYGLFQKGIIQGLRNRNDEKLALLARLVSDYPTSPYADDALLESGVTYLEMRQWAAAERVLLQLVNQYKGKSELVGTAYLKLGLVNYNQGRIEQALTYYKEIFKHNPTSKEARDALAAIEEIYVIDMGRPNDYVAFVESIPGYKVSAGERDSLNYQVALRLYENGDYAKAVDAFSDYLQRFPQGFHALESVYFRAESNSILRKFDPALADYERTIARGPSRFYLPSLEKAALISYNHAESFEKAFQYYAKLEAETTQPDVRFQSQLGAMRSAYRTGKTEATLTYASKVASYPGASVEEKATAQFFRGKIMFDSRKYDEALGYFAEVIDQSDNENTAEARYRMAEIYFIQNKIDQAEGACRQSYSQSSAYPSWVARSLILLSDVLVKKQDFFNARAALEAVIDNFSEDTEILKTAKDKLAALERQERRIDRIDPGTSEGN